MSFTEIVLILLVVLLVMGPEKLPEAARWLGKGMRELRRASNLLRDTLIEDDLDLDRPRRRPAAAEKGSSAARLEEPSPPRLADEPPPAFDQLDDEAFDDALAQHFRLDHSPTRVVLLQARREADGLREVPLLAPADAPACRRIDLIQPEERAS